MTRHVRAVRRAHRPNRGNSRAVALADVALANTITVQTRIPTPTVGIVRPQRDPIRLQKAAQTVVTVAEASEVPDAIVKRLARSEPLEAAAIGYSDAMRQQPLVEGWVREFHGEIDPATGKPGCQLCVWWWREGRIWPKAHPFQTHKGCDWTPKVVLAEHIPSTQFTRRSETNAARTGDRINQPVRQRRRR